MKPFGLKWRLFLATAGLTALLMAALYLFNEHVLAELFATEREQALERMGQAIDALYVNWRQKTEEIAGTLASNPTLGTAIALRRPAAIEQILHQQAPVMNFDAGVASVEVYTFAGRHLASWPQPMSPDKDVLGALKVVARTFRPSSFVRCAASRCIHFTVVPVLGRHGKTAGLLVVAFEMSDLLFGFHGAAGINEIKLLAPGQQAAAAARILSTKDLRLPSGYTIVSFFDNRRETSSIAALQRRFLLFGALVLVLLAVLIWVSLWSPLTRLKRVADTLPLLAERRYSDLRQRLHGKPAIKDEVDTVTNVVVSVSLQLEELLAAEQRIAREAARGELAERYSAAKSSFVAQVNHELRAPLNSIVGLSELLRLGIQGDPRTYIDKLRASAQSLLGLVEQLLDISRIEAGHVVTEHVPFAIRQLLDEVTDVVYSSAQQKGITVTPVCSEAVPSVVVGDRSRLRQVLLNLTANGVKYTERGSVTLRVLPLDAPQVQFVVEDTGPGIPAEHVAQIFEPYNRGDADVARRYPGYGLGMVIAKTLVGAMGGELCVESTVGVGTRFYFAIALPVGELPAKDESRPIAAPRRALQVLVADDDDVNRLVLDRLLTANKCEITAVANGDAALSCLSTRAFDAAIVDLEMPLLSGIEVVQHARRSGSQVRFIILTGDATQSTRDACLNAGADVFMAKPFSTSRLLAELWGTSGGTEPMTDASSVGGGGELIDRSRVALLYQLGRNAALEIIDAFSTTAPANVGGLDIALQQGNHVEVKRLLHKLKGSAFGVGAVAVVRCCDGAYANLSSLDIDQLRCCVRSTISALRHELEQT